MCSSCHPRRSWIFLASSPFLSRVSELLWGTTPPLYSQHNRLSRRFHFFLGCRPHWGLFKHIFTCRSQTVKKANPSDERTQVIQMCGGLGIQMRGKSSFPTMILPDSVRGRQSTWFYCKDQLTPGQSTGLPPFTMDRVRKPSPLKVLPEEKAQVRVLVG